tara:strand:- start:125 stop:595 length:471 start_codon:yes stop_codon:yes gene_type:complete
MFILFQAADVFGAWTTLLLVVLTAVIGLNILKKEGLSIFLRANERLNSGELPAQEIIEAMFLAGAGALLITPGFLTDFAGFSLLIRPLREFFAKLVIRAGIFKATTMGDPYNKMYWSTYNKSSEVRPGDVYEGEFMRDNNVSEIEGSKGKNISKNN